nr:hypothetical protein [Nostoc sp. ChiSLP03a]MDZ8215795.1 hypothetical protein [Nostoc sp. ChiSLP03a]
MNDWIPLLLKELQESQPELTEDLLSDCVSQLTKLEKAAIMFQTTRNESSRILLNYYYLEDSTSSKFESWVAELYEEVINTLTYSISEILD